MAESNKNQTAAERARLKEALGAQLTDHICVSPNCPSPGERIVMKELFPVVTPPPRRRPVFSHKACGPKLAYFSPPARLSARERGRIRGNVGLQNPLDRQHVRTQALVLIMVA